MKKICFWIIQLIQYLALFFVSSLFVGSLLYQTILPMDGSELAQMNGTSYKIIILALFFILGLAISIPLLSRIKESSLFLIFTVMYILLGSFLILHVTDVLRFDARVVYDAAVSLNDENNSTLALDAYLYRYPHQLGLVTFERISFSLFQTTSPKMLFFLNLVFVIGINFSIWSITKRLFGHVVINKIVIVLSFLFLPQFFFILFAYGHIPGLFFLMLGTYGAISFLQKEQIFDAVLMILATGIAYTIRNNYSIFIIAVVIIFVLQALMKKSGKPLAVIISLIAVCFLSQSLLTQHYEKRAGHPLPGIPKIAWVTMGFNDNPVYNRVPGWYDAYVETVYTENKGDTDAIAKQSVQDLKERLVIMSQHPVYTLRFFKNKFISTWEDSLFQSVWSGPVKSEGQSVQTSLLQGIYYGKRPFYYLYALAHAGLIFLYFSLVVGTVILMKRDRQIPLPILLLPLYLLGGVFFHLFWETKSQYVYSYVFMMLPLSASGFYHCQQLLNKKFMGYFKK